MRLALWSLGILLALVLLLSGGLVMLARHDIQKSLSAFPPSLTPSLSLLPCEIRFTGQWWLSMWFSEKGSDYPSYGWCMRPWRYTWWNLTS